MSKTGGVRFVTKSRLETDFLAFYPKRLFSYESKICLPEEVIEAKAIWQFFAPQLSLCAYFTVSGASYFCFNERSRVAISKAFQSIRQFKLSKSLQNVKAYHYSN